MNPIAFFIGPLAVHWYGIILAFALLVGICVSLWQARLFGATRRTVLYLILCCIPTGFLTARLYFVLTHWTVYKNNPLEWFSIWHGGLAIHGAFLGVVAAILVYTYSKRLSFWRYADILTPGIAITQAIGQWGNFINQEAFGYPTNDVWGIYIDFASRPFGFQQYDFFQPTFLYESGLAFLIFLIAIIRNVFNNKQRNFAEGSTFLLYIFIYSAGRFFIEDLRIDSEIIYGMRLAQAICLFLIATVLIICLKRQWLSCKLRVRGR
ncbi:Prolipoprotein diacylglyceryl transferase [bioreactor metagenome]|uniref:Prolipoprotein diacylglyceryl transferase n=1 Tax=bioreactor metagenome TaxID=1076179 RepID=A0A644T1E5_9ZZZZ|nr:prolipoprotein diacylglyceryl transferase [Negativicutes bacterium]